MRVVLTIDDEDAEVVALQVRQILWAVTRHNLWLMHRLGDRIPPLYQSPIRFRVEPWADKVQFYANCQQALYQRFADCKVLCCYRMGELLRGRPPAEWRGYGFKIYWRRHDREDVLHEGLGAERGELRVYHVQIRHPDGGIEDPSRLLHT